MMQLSFTINGNKRQVSAAPMKRLLDLIREDLALTGTKEGCGEGECGACSVMMDGLLVLSCMVPVCQIQGKSIITIEGVGDNEVLHPIQRAFHEHGGSQCGMCTPGMILAALYYLKNPNEAEDVREALAGNQCRCTGYTRIFKSMDTAVRHTTGSHGRSH
jgi:aerobic carbon-monoxide dehydrogenase small subunit